MLIAVACDANKAKISERYDEAEYIIVYETEDESIVREYKRTSFPAHYLAREFDYMFVECIVCGIMREEEFEPIASKQITRYDGSGLDIVEAIHAAEMNYLPLITDYENGTGCNDSLEAERMCSGDCAVCDDKNNFYCENEGKVVQ